MLPPGWTISDGGDVRTGSPSPLRDPSTGLCNSDALVSMVEQLSATVAAARFAGRLPVVLGGDCAVLLGALAGASVPPPVPADPLEGPEPVDIPDGPLGLLFVDGHEDAWPPLSSPSGEAADSELGLALGLPPDTPAPAGLAALLPLVEPDLVAVLGARDATEIAAAGVASLRDRVLLRTAAELAAPGPHAGPALARAGAPAAVLTTHALGVIRRRATRWWLHVDLDVLSTESLPAVDYRQPGGLTWEHLTALTRTALGTPGLAGWSITVYNPDLDLDRSGAARIVDYLAESLSALPAALVPQAPTGNATAASPAA
jgi:arginase